jgi:dihydrofolate synthase/folylpolyglutamate synthase
MTRPVIDLGTDRVKNVLAQFGSPHEKIKKVVHVTGTNGKGSVCEMIFSGLKGTGVIGIFTSPFVVQETDSIRVMDRMGQCGDIPQSSLRKFRGSVSGFDLTSFEALFICACLFFVEMEVETAIIEVGMGGLLDATNVFTQPTVCVLTGVSMDHEKFLGNSIEEICGNKCGIVHSGSDLIVNGSLTCLQVVESEFTKRHGGNLIVLPVDHSSQLIPPLRGDHQTDLMRMALTATQILRPDIPVQNIILNIQTTRLHGRLEYRPHDFEFPVLLDGAHNYESTLALRKYVDSQFPSLTKFWIIATSKGRERVVVENLVNDVDEFRFVKFKSFDEENSAWVQCADPGELVDCVPRGSHIKASALAAYVNDAIQLVKLSIGGQPGNHLVIVSGSLYLVRHYLRFISGIA